MGYLGNQPAAGLIGGGNVQDGSITNADLAAGVAVANLGYTPVNKAGDTITQTNAAANALVVNMPTGTANTASAIKVRGHSPSIELMDKDGVQNWYVGVDDTSSNEFVIGRGYGVNQNAPKAVVIDSSDRVLLPYQPGFLASVAGGTYTSGVFGGSLVTNHGTPTQRSSGYNNGTYTAPVSGLYQFNFVMYDFNATTVTLAVYINGSGYIPGDWYQFVAHGNVQNTWSYQVYLNANDYIQMGIRHTSSINMYSGHTYWGGYLIG